VTDIEPFDRNLRRWRHARADLSRAGFLHEAMAEELRERAALTGEAFADVLDLGGPAPVWPGAVRVALGPAGADVVADEDRLPFAENSFDLVVSAGGLATVNDLPGALVQIRRVLRPGGLFLAAIPGGMTLVELRAALIEAEAAITGGAAARTAPMVEAQAAAGLLQRAGLVNPVSDIEHLTVRYPSIFRLFEDLTAMGARSALASRTALRRDVLAAAAANFAARADADGKVPVSVDIIHLAGKKPPAAGA
jgi:SAM-dependent methyltransferase